MDYRQRYAFGFTVVELLIVIVVIAILASITVVAYNGTQVRATNAKIASDARALQKSIMLYKEAYGHFPMYSGTPGSVGGGFGYACIGNAFDAKNDFAQGECVCSMFSGDVDWTCIHGFNPQLTVELKKTIKNVPDTSQYVFRSSGGNNWRGMLYAAGEDYPSDDIPWNTGDPTIERARLWYNLIGDNQECPIGEPGGFTADIYMEGTFPQGITSCKIIISAS